MTYETDLVELQPVLHRYACKLTRSMVDADDLLQDTLLRALEKRHLFDGSNLIAWCTTMMRRLHIDSGAHGEGRKRFDPIEDVVLVMPPLQESRVRACEMLAMVRLLPLTQQDALIRSEYAGQTLEQMSIATGVPTGTLKSRVSRGHRELREMDR